jgi:beta-lactamase class A
MLGRSFGLKEIGAMRKLLVVLALSLAVPSLALAAKPPAPGNSQPSHGNAAPQVMYVLKGTLTAYTAASGTTNGSVSLLVKSANHHGATLKGQTLTFPVASTTKVVTGTATAVTVNNNGLVQIRGPKTVTPAATLAAVLQALTARQVIDQGPAT